MLPRAELMPLQSPFAFLSLQLSVRHEECFSSLWRNALFDAWGMLRPLQSLPLLLWVHTSLCRAQAAGRVLREAEQWLMGKPSHKCELLTVSLSPQASGI